MYCDYASILIEEVVVKELERVTRLDGDSVRVRAKVNGEESAKLDVLRMHTM